MTQVKFWNVASALLLSLALAAPVAEAGVGKRAGRAAGKVVKGTKQVGEGSRKAARRAARGVNKGGQAVAGEVRKAPKRAAYAAGATVGAVEKGGKAVGRGARKAARRARENTQKLAADAREGYAEGREAQVE